MVPSPTFAFFGTPKFAAIVLEELTKAGFFPKTIICNPDRPVGRKKIITPPPIKQLVASNGWSIKIIQPENLKTHNLKPEISNLDLFIVAAYANIIPKEILELSRLGVIGVHPSLLPKYRGASPIQSVLLAGEKRTGVTLYLMDEKMDHGPILSQSECKIDTNENYETLENKLAVIGGNLLAEILPKFLNGEIKPSEQDHEEASTTKKFKTEDGFVAPKDLIEAQNGNQTKSEMINNKIRALGIEPGVWTIQNNKRVRLLNAKIEGNKLILQKIQEEGKKPRTP